LNKFLFITHITPKSKRSVFRQGLIDIYFAALNAQTYSDWKVIILGDEEKTEGKFHFFSLPDGTREEKFEVLKKLLSREEIKLLFSEADYVIKLDDDDIISPVLLEQLKNFKGDLCFDRFHTFIDSSSGIITQQERQWIASTCVHKREHVLSAWTGPGASAVGNLLYSEHSKSWHLFYKDKNVVEAEKGNPVYLRVLSPTSITSGALHGPPKTIAEVSMPKYYEYLKNFGEWNSANLNLFDAYLPRLAQAWMNFSGSGQKSIPSEYLRGKTSGILSKIKNRLSRKGK
jgi:hypothetical protein